MLRNFDRENCLKQTIADSINCSSKSCEKIRDNSHEFESTGIDFGQNRQYNSFGGQLHGFRYSIFVIKQSIKDSSADLNALKLLAPFGTLGSWIKLFTIICLRLALKITVIQNNLYCWLFGVMLEQEDDKRKWANLYNWFLIFVWLYACHLIRSQYTSSLYTHMTKESDPTGIPTSFKELVYNSSIKLIIDGSTNSYIWKFEEKLKTSNQFHLYNS